MRRQFLLQPILWAVTLILFSCQKETIKNEPNDQLVSKINSWLDSRKPLQKQTQAENVELLKANLEFSNLRIEQSREGEKIIVIPVNENFKTIKNLDKASIPNLVLVLDKMGNVRKGNLVLFYPQDGQVYSKVPDNTFYNILNTSKPECNGKFKYLSVTGKRLHELEYENGHLKYFGYATDSSMNQRNGRINTFCVDWYWVYTWYDEWGNIWSQSQEYYTTTCQGEDCEDPYNAMLCPMDNSSGGGTGVSGDWEFAVSRPWKWDVGSTSNYLAVSYENVDGVKIANEPQGGHFTGKAHVGSYFTVAIPGYTWQEVGNTLSIDNPQRVYSSTTGKAFAPNGTFTTHSGWMFASFNQFF